MNFASLRQHYGRLQLRSKDLHANPFDQFNRWFGEAQDAQIIEPNAMVLATSTPTEGPAARTVLLKHVSEDGFVFFTHYGSTKARHIEENPRVSLLLLWLPLERQITIYGTATKTSAALSDHYFQLRPRNSQIGAHVGLQSQAIKDRAILEADFQYWEKTFANQAVPRPSNWGGYVVMPDRFEFWQGREDRLHDRLEYRRQADKDQQAIWKIQRLGP